MEPTIECVFQGQNSGLGSYSKNEIEVVTFGPHRAPLGDCTGFGAFSADGLIKETKQQDGFAAKGWVRLADLESWLHVVASAKKGHLFLDVTPEKLGDQGWYFVFFIRSKKAFVQSQTLRPNSLDRYQGKALPVFFRGEKEEIKIESPCSSHMDLIPLAGENFFWGANFLLAFPITFDRPLKNISISG